MKKIGIIGAMEIEVDALRGRMKEPVVTTAGTMDFYEGELAGMPAVVVRSGVGKVNAAVCTQLLISRFGVDGVINTGIGGSLNAGIDIGDIVLSTDLVHHDVDAAVFGYAKGQIPQMPVFSFEADEGLRELAAEACAVVNPDIRVFQGRIASGDQFISDRTVKEQIVREFHALAVEMEGAAIAQVCVLNRIPFLVIRAVSDKADDSAVMDYGAFEKMACENSLRLTQQMMESLACRA